MPSALCSVSALLQFKRSIKKEMLSEEIDLHYIGGPIVLLELAGLKMLTDPSFDSRGTDYRTPVYTLHKTLDPLMKSEELPSIDLVLLSHDHHFDNLDHSGRAFLSTVKEVLTTVEGAARLGDHAKGLKHWET